MNPIKLYLVLSAILCISVLYAEENTYIKQQVAYKDQGASGKELTWDFEHIYQEGELLEISTCRKF